jgi:hypothetical protein
MISNGFLQVNKNIPHICPVTKGQYRRRIQSYATLLRACRGRRRIGGEMKCLASVLVLMLAALLVPSSNASAGCIDVLNVRKELPYDVATPMGKSLSYFYNLDREQYVVFLSRNGEEATPHGPFVLQRNCHPATLKWESESFVLFEAGCGTFCWTVDALSMAGQTQSVFRPLDFDASRNLILFYAEQDVIGVRNLATLREQKIRTNSPCESASDLCFSDARFSGDRVTYRQDGRLVTAILEPTHYDQ